MYKNSVMINLMRIFANSKKEKRLLKEYFCCLDQCNEILNSFLLSNEQKLQRIDTFRQCFETASSNVENLQFENLRKLFLAENLDKSLIIDVLDFYKKNIQINKFSTWSELLMHIHQETSAFGRFWMAVYYQNPSTYMPAENLCMVWQCFDILRKVKQNYSCFKKCYLPLELIDKYQININDLGLETTKPEIAQALNDVILLLEKTMEDAKILPSLIKGFRLKIKIRIIVSLTIFMIQKYKEVDLLQNMPYPGFWDWGMAVIMGLFGRDIKPKHL